MSDNELHDTTGAQVTEDNESGLPPAIANRLPEKYQTGEHRVGTARESVVNEEDTEVVTVAATEDGEDVLYWFEMREIPWQEKNRIFKDNVNQVAGSGQLQIDTYYREVAEAKIEGWFGEDDMSLTTWLTGVRAEIGEKLEPHLPDPVGQLEEAEEGN
jgi:hypothetical protein